MIIIQQKKKKNMIINKETNVWPSDRIKLGGKGFVQPNQHLGLRASWAMYTNNNNSVLFPTFQFVSW